MMVTMASTSKFAFLAFTLLYLFTVHFVHGDDGSSEEMDSADDHLLTQIDCKVGDKYKYVMVTQSSLMNQFDGNVMLKAKIDLRCVRKQPWRNETTGETKQGQLFEAQITSLNPVKMDQNKVETVTIKPGGIQMAALFQSLNQLPETKRNGTAGSQPNLKVGAVNQFFVNFARSLGELIIQLFHKVVNFFENMLHKSRKGGTQPAVRTTGFSWKCSNKSSETSKRIKRQSFTLFNINQLSKHIEDMFKLPFTFVQLTDGSIQNVRLSYKESDPRVKHFKHFLAQSFATQLDERKKMALEESTLGKHNSHYQIEYDEPDRAKMTPEEYIAATYEHVNRRRRRRSSSSHMVSVIRTVQRADMITENNSGNERNQYRHKTLQLANVQFTAQQVQLIDDHMLVASGGFFRSVVPIELNARHRRQSAAQTTGSTTSTTNQTADDFDTILQKYLTMDLEYSMVRMTKNRWRRSAEDMEQQQQADGSRYQLNDRAISTYVTLMSKIAQTTAANHTASATTVANLVKRIKRENTNKEHSNVVCNVKPKNSSIVVRSQTESEESNIIKDNVANQDKECYEYKEFGSGLLKAYFNRTIRTGVRSGKSIEQFDSHYKLGAQLLGEDMFMGQIEISKNHDLSRLRVNLFGSEYIDLNLCDINGKPFSQAGHIPLFAENIWFMTDVKVNIKYDLQFLLRLPTAVCDGVSGGETPINNGDMQPTNNSIILGRLMTDQFELEQNSKIDLASSFEASFLIFHGEAKLNGNFDMDSDIDFGNSCFTAKSVVKPMNVSLDFNYKFFHPLCGEWMEESWIPKQLSWKLTKDYHNSWFDNVCP